MKLLDYIFQWLENWNRKQFLKANILYQKKLKELQKNNKGE